MLAAALSGCSAQQTFTAREETFDAAGISSVVIDVQDREVAVGVSDDGAVHVDCFESEKEYYEIVRSEEGVLTISLVLDKA